MVVPVDVLMDFAKAINHNDKKERPTTIKYGTVARKNGDEAYVVIDGSDAEMPVHLAMDADPGDRVSVMIKDHMAMVTGNVTSPASAKTASKYMKLTDDGLIIGTLGENGSPSGAYVLIEEDTYSICEQDGTVIASYYGTGTTLASGSGRINVVDDVLFLIGERATGVRSSFASGADTFYAEAITLAESNSPVCTLQVRNSDNSVGSRLVVSKNNVDVVTSGTFSVNGYECINTNNLLIDGKITIKRKIAADSVGCCQGIAELPFGYELAGIREITVTDRDTGNKSKQLTLQQFFTHPNTEKVGAYIYNTSSSQKRVECVIEWFAVKASSIASQTPAVIDLGDDTDSEDY